MSPSPQPAAPQATADAAAPPEPGPRRQPSDAAYLFSAAICAILIAIPLLSVTLPPITDLPQQTAQIRLLIETLGSDDSPYRVQWLHPNKLGYLPLLVSWLATSPLAAGRVGVLILGLLWVGALHGLARATGRPPAAAALASLFFYNHLTYWGLLNALIGLPVFAWWFVVIERTGAARPSLRSGLKLLGIAILLYSAHVLWLAAGLAWLTVATLAVHRSWRLLLVRLAWVSPMWLAALVWYPRLQQSGFVSDTHWGRSPFGRLHPEWWLNSAFGGLQGRVEPTLTLVVGCWLLLGFLTWWRPSLVGARDAAAEGGHRSLLLAGICFVAAALTLPAVIQSTIFFASRWLPVGVVLLVLGWPQPRVRPLLRAAVPYLALASLTAATAAVWIEFEQRELDGLHAALAAIPTEQRVLGLDMVRTSERIKGFPFYHFYAYAQVLHGGELARSFANFGSSLVVYRDMPRKFPWTEGLDWRARKLRRSDIDHFQYLLIYGDHATQAPFRADPRLQPVTEERLWRLYRVAPPATPTKPVT
ncbi:MAG: hypothetical protein AAF560_10430 [Acidobacteriota bacterium]